MKYSAVYIIDYVAFDHINDITLIKLSTATDCNHHIGKQWLFIGTDLFAQVENLAKREIMLLTLCALFVAYMPFTIYPLNASSQSDMTLILKPAYGQTPDIGSPDPSLGNNSTNISNSTDASRMDNGTDITNQNDDLGGQNTIPDVSSDIGNPVENTTATNGTQINKTANQAVPEFGTISELVLIAAIASIIMISAKTGLRFIPRY